MNVVAFCVDSTVIIVSGVHTLKLMRSFTHAVNWSSELVVGFRSREMPSNCNSWNEISQLFDRPVCPENVCSCNASSAYCGQCPTLSLLRYRPAGPATS